MERKSFRPEERGYGNHYRDGEVNYCPGCNMTHWIIGRMLAECAKCGTAKPLSGGTGTAKPRIVERRGGFQPTVIE